VLPALTHETCPAAVQPSLPPCLRHAIDHRSSLCLVLSSAPTPP
jgi:hypothetical protein